MLLSRIRPGRKGWMAIGLLVAAMLALWIWQPWAGPRVEVFRLAAHPLTNTVVATGYVSNTEESVLGATLTARGLGAYSTKPMASTPAATAASTSCSRVRPQTLMRVRCRGAGAGDWGGTGWFMAANHTQRCGWANPISGHRPGLESTGRRAKTSAPPLCASAPPARPAASPAFACLGRRPAGSP